MVKEIVWTSSALNDLELIVEYIYRDSPIYALAFYDEVRETGKNLDELAKRGRVVPEFNDINIREVFIQSYRLLYQTLDNQIVILTIIHGARILNK